MASAAPGAAPPRLPSDAVKAVIFSEDALAPVDRLWADAVGHLARRLGRVEPLDPATIPADRSQALTALEAWADGDVSTWRAELARYYEEHIPVYVRPNPDAERRAPPPAGRRHAARVVVARAARGGTWSSRTSWG